MFLLKPQIFQIFTALHFETSAVSNVFKPIAMYCYVDVHSSFYFRVHWVKIFLTKVKVNTHRLWNLNPPPRHPFVALLVVFTFENIIFIVSLETSDKQKINSKKIWTRVD